MANFNWTFVNVDGVVNVNAISASTYISASTIYATDITASNYIVENVHNIDVSGSTTFGNTNDDVHIRTGSLLVVSSSTTIFSASVSATPGSSFIYASKMGVATTSPSQALTVVGDISASVGITGSTLETATTFINATHVSSSLNISGAAFYGDGSLLTGISPITTYSNASDNRVITSVDSSTISGEANLTFDGSKLSATGQISASLGVTGSVFETATTVINSTHISSSLNVSASEFYGNGAKLTGISPITTYSNVADNRVLTSVDASSINSEANLTFDGTDLSVISATSARPRLYIQNENADEHPGQLIFNKTSSSPADDDTIGRIAFTSHDSAGNATAYGQIEGEIKKPNSGGERGRIKFSVAEYDGTLTEALTLEGDNADGTVSVTVANGTFFVPNGNIQLFDDRKIVFGNGSDASFEYDEDGTDTLLYAGASFRISDDVKLEFGSGGDAYIEYDENGRDRLILSGAAVGGLEISGSAVYLDINTVGSGAIAGESSYLGIDSEGRMVLTASSGGGTPGGADTQIQYNNDGVFDGIAVFTWDDTNINIADDTKLRFGSNADASFEYDENSTDTLLYDGASFRISDDVKLEFGTGGDAYIEYDENGRDRLILSGAAAGGLEISGSAVYLDINTVGSGTLAGGSSYLGVDSEGKMVLTASSGGGGTPGGADTQIQYNNDGAFDGIAAFTWDDTNINIADDTKLRFGNGGDASIEYDENGTDELRFAGASVIFEQDVTLNGANAYFKSATSNRPRVYIESSNADANAGQLIFNKTSSSPANDDVIGSIVFSSYDAGGGATVYGQIKSDIKTVTAGGERGRVRIYAAENDGTLTEGLTVQGGSSDGVVDVTVANGGLYIPNGDLTLYDDRKLYFGNGQDAYIEYDEDSSDKLIISASSGPYISGSAMTIATNLTVTGDTDDNPSITIENNSDGAAGGQLLFKRTSTDEDNNDNIGIVGWMAKDAGGNDTQYAQIIGQIDDTTSGGEEGRLVFKVAEFDGTVTEGFRIEGQASNGIVDCLVSNGSLQFKDLGGAGTTPASGFGGLYVNSDKLYFINDSGGSTELGAGASAAGNNTFSGTNTFSAALTASSGIDLGGSLSYATAVKTADFDAGLNEYLFFCDLTGSAITGTLPDAGTAGAGKSYIFKDVSGSASTFNLVISGSGADLIDGATQVKVTSNSGSVTCVSNGSDWFIIGTS